MAAQDHPGFEAGDTTVIWRYMTLPRFRDLLAGHLYFAAAHQFDDPFEGAITDAECAWREASTVSRLEDDVSRQSWLTSLSEAFRELRWMTKINCWHAATTENVAMWERYLPRGEAGVVVKSTVGALKQSLQPFHLKPEYGEETIFVARLRYIDFAKDPLAHRSMLELFLYKRIEYRDEQEIRAVLPLRMAVEFGVEIPTDGALVAVDLAKLIHEVRVSPPADEHILDDVRATISARGLDAKVTKSTLAQRPNY